MRVRATEFGHFRSFLTFASHAFCGSFGDENGKVEQHNGWLGRGNAELKSGVH